MHPNNKAIRIPNCLKSDINYGYMNTMVKDVSIPDLGIYDKHLDKDNNRLTGTKGVTSMADSRASSPELISIVIRTGPDRWSNRK